VGNRRPGIAPAAEPPTNDQAGELVATVEAGELVATVEALDGLMVNRAAG